MGNKIAVVFGGSRGIGAASVEALARNGYDVAYTYVSAAPDKPVEIPGSRVEAFKVDIGEPDEIAGMLKSVEDSFGAAPDLIFANAGVNVPPGPMAQFDAGNFRGLVEVNIVGAFNILQAAARAIADKGAIVATTTSMVRMAIPGVAPYTASKAAVEVFVRSMSKELAGRGVRVNAVAPGPVDTDLFRAGKDDAAVQRSAGLSVFNRVGRPEEVAEVVVFLASDKASWITGQIIQPNGGMV